MRGREIAADGRDRGGGFSWMGRYHLVVLDVGSK
jgi:hypothetical protein